MSETRFLMVGGFLGAGKTTALARLAKHYIDEGKRVGLVTNDQAYDLVDTKTLRAQGFNVGEVPGACFCCKFDDLVQTVSQLAADAAPDILLAEPVGSCTDLVATVIEPLNQLHGNQYAVGPLAVLLKPEHGQRILRDDSQLGFSPKAAYIFLKQIEEADIVVINKIDKLTADEKDELIDLIRTRFPDKKVLAASAKLGEGWEDLINAMEQPRYEKPSMKVDYDVYAEGEAEMGWLNGTAVLKRSGLALQEVSQRMVSEIAADLAAHQAEPIHLKVMASGGDGWSVANLVSSQEEIEASQLSSTTSDYCELTINARVAADPALLAEWVQAAIQRLANSLDASYEITDLQHFRPGRPVPTHRLVSGNE